MTKKKMQMGAIKTKYCEASIKILSVFESFFPHAHYINFRLEFQTEIFLASKIILVEGSA